MSPSAFSLLAVRPIHMLPILAALPTYKTTSEWSLTVRMNPLGVAGTGAVTSSFSCSHATPTDITRGTESSPPTHTHLYTHLGYNLLDFQGSVQTEASDRQSLRYPGWKIISPTLTTLIIPLSDGLTLSPTLHKIPSSVASGMTTASFRTF